jgi:hypothetical protein
MNPRNADEKPKRKPEDARREAHAKEARARETQAKEVHAKAEEASRSVMHPESFDPEWRYYHGAWGG